MPSELQTIPRINRICSGKDCSHAALFYPVILFWKTSKRIGQPVQVEIEEQFCQRCRDKITSIKQFGLDFPELFKRVFPDRKVGTILDFEHHAIAWMPLIIDVESQQPQAQHPLHD